MDTMYRRILPAILSLVLALMMFGCLAPDPGLDPLSETENEEKITHLEIITSGPIKN